MGVSSSLLFRSSGDGLGTRRSSENFPVAALRQEAPWPSSGVHGLNISRRGADFQAPDFSISAIGALNPGSRDSGTAGSRDGQPPGWRKRVGPPGSRESGQLDKGGQEISSRTTWTPASTRISTIRGGGWRGMKLISPL